MTRAEWSRVAALLVLLVVLSACSIVIETRDQVDVRTGAVQVAAECRP